MTAVFGSLRLVLSLRCDSARDDAVNGPDLPVCLVRGDGERRERRVHLSGAFAVQLAGGVLRWLMSSLNQYILHTGLLDRSRWIRL